MNSIKKMCGAKTRQGTPCKNTRLYKNGRCKNHGGLSTGPRTEKGKERALANLKKPEEKASFWTLEKDVFLRNQGVTPAIRAGVRARIGLHHLQVIYYEVS